MSKSYEVGLEQIQPPLSRREDTDLLFRGVGAARNVRIGGVDGCVVIDGARRIWFHEGGRLASDQVAAQDPAV